MSQGFVPFIADAKEVPRSDAGSQPRIVTNPKSAQPFRPLAGHVAPAAGPSANGEPRISLERDGNRVTRITVHCCCGHTIELACT